MNWVHITLKEAKEETLTQHQLMVKPIQAERQVIIQLHRAHVIQETEKIQQIVSQEEIHHVLLYPTAVRADQAPKEETEEKLKTQEQ